MMPASELWRPSEQDGISALHSMCTRARLASAFLSLLLCFVCGRFERNGTILPCTYLYFPLRVSENSVGSLGL